MTLVAAWTRTTESGKELWVISDSRLSGGMFWDFGPKIFGIGRSDAVVAFAGDTTWSYPLIAQITSHVESFINLRDRVIDIGDAFESILKILNESLSFVSAPVTPELKTPECTFIFGGYSARRKDFFLRRVVFNLKRRRFESRKPWKSGGEEITVIGDRGPRSELTRRMWERRGSGTTCDWRLNITPRRGVYRDTAV